MKGGKREQQRETDRKKGAALCLGVGEEKEGTLCCIDFCADPALHGKAKVALGWLKPSRKEGP